MRLQSSTALIASALLLCACGTDTGNEAANGAAPNGEPSTPSAPGDVNGNGAVPPGETPPPGQPGNGAEEPEPAAEVTLSASPGQVTEGATVTLTLRNGSEQQIGYNLCTSALETAAGSDVPTGRVCTMELRLLEPGRTATYPYELPLNVAEGSYRFATQIHWMASDRTSLIRSNAIDVRSD